MSPGGSWGSVLGSPAGPSNWDPAWVLPGAPERRWRHLGVIRARKVSPPYKSAPAHPPWLVWGCWRGGVCPWAGWVCWLLRP